MKFHKYIQKTLRRGSYFAKLVKLCRFFQHTIYFMLRKQIGEIKSPGSNVIEIGFFDRNRLIHTEPEFKSFFKTSNIYKEGDFIHMKPGLISLAKSDDGVMVKKTFRGVKRINQFYNELVCLNRLKDSGVVPEVYYADYRSQSIYMEYLGGQSVTRGEMGNRLEVTNENYFELKNGFENSLKKIHDRGVVIYDLRDENMMICSNSKFYFMDFGDSIYYGSMLADYVDRLKRIDFYKINVELSLSAADDKVKEMVFNA